jgi:hypothetical protein
MMCVITHGSSFIPKLILSCDDRLPYSGRQPACERGLIFSSLFLWTFSRRLVEDSQFSGLLAVCGLSSLSMITGMIIVIGTCRRASCLGVVGVEWLCRKNLMCLNAHVGARSILFFPTFSIDDHRGDHHEPRTLSSVWVW